MRKRRSLTRAIKTYTRRNNITISHDLHKRLTVGPMDLEEEEDMDSLDLGLDPDMLRYL